MASPLPPDPYVALGLPKDATPAAIKTTYRKLVLKCHPDKVQDEAEKADAVDRFHKIQTAYEIIGDEERRARYDAQAKLAELRREMMEKGITGSRGGVDVRTASYRMPPESARGGEYFTRGPERSSRVSPHYEERRPSYAEPEYFDAPPKASARKYDDYDRSSKRASSREGRDRAKTSTREAKENERSSRKEKSKRAEKDMRRDRDRKNGYEPPSAEVEADSDSSGRRRRMAEEDPEELRRARDAYREKARRQNEDAGMDYFGEGRAKKIFSQEFEALGHMGKSTRPMRQRSESERQISPTRANSSSREKLDQQRKDSRPHMPFRVGSGPISRTKTTGRDVKSSSLDKELDQSEIADEPRDMRREERDSRRPATLEKMRSSPADIRIPEKARSQSLQEDFRPIPRTMRRSETLPSPGPTPIRESRQNEEPRRRSDVHMYPSPESSPEPPSRKYKYGPGQKYADDAETPTTEGFSTEVREPEPKSRRRGARSPSPAKERPRSTSQKQPPPMPRTTSRQYSYAPEGSRRDSYGDRPQVSRENSSRGGLFGEIFGSSRSPKPVNMFTPPPDDIQSQRPYRQEDIRTQSGYSSRKSERPSYSRSSSNQIRVGGR